MSTPSPMIFMKLYTSLLDEAVFNRLPAESKWSYIQLLMLAAMNLVHIGKLVNRKIFLSKQPESTMLAVLFILMQVHLQQP